LAQTHFLEQYQKIRAEKKRLIKEKKIKPDKKKSVDKSHYGKNVPFEVPESWEWVSGFDVFKPMTSKKPTNGTFTYIDINAIDNSKNCIVNPKILEATNAPSRASREVKSGDTLFSMVRPYLMNIAYVDSQYKNSIASTGFFVCRPNELLFPKFLYYLMLSPFVVYGLNSFMKGDNSPSINNDNIISFQYPLPPLSEQHRIIDKIEKLFDLIDIINESNLSLEQLLAQAKSKILDLAIRGKLVPQDPEEETASMLLKKIRKDDKIKKVSSDTSHYPFDIPSNWIWLNGSQCFNSMINKKPEGDYFRYIDIEAIDNKNHVIKEAKKIRVADAPSRASRLINEGDTLFSMVRPYLENIAYVDKQYDKCIASTGFYVCKPNKLLFPKYLYFLMQSKYVINGLNLFMKGDNSPSINNSNITSFLYPIPPISEQRRIVNKIEEIFQRTDKIQENLKANI
jgi:type I restriction enzyme S subunit